jgi:hypothetical protein
LVRVYESYVELRPKFGKIGAITATGGAYQWAPSKVTVEIGYFDAISIFICQVMLLGICNGITYPEEE